MALVLAMIPGAWGAHFIQRAYGGPDHTPLAAWIAIALLLLASLSAAFYLDRRYRRGR
jgi:hypothetical protein